MLYTKRVRHRERVLRRGGSWCTWVSLGLWQGLTVCWNLRKSRWVVQRRVTRRGTSEWRCGGQRRPWSVHQLERQHPAWDGWTACRSGGWGGRPLPARAEWWGCDFLKPEGHLRRPGGAGCGPLVKIILHMKRYLFRTILGRKRKGKRKKGGRDKGRKEKSQELDVLIYVITNECESGQAIICTVTF